MWTREGSFGYSIRVWAFDTSRAAGVGTLGGTPACWSLVDLTRDLPMVRTWSRWEGNDRSGCGIEIDVVAPLASGGVMTGSVKWNPAPPRACDGSADRTREHTFVELGVPALFDRFLRTRDVHAPQRLTSLVRDVTLSVQRRSARLPMSPPWVKRVW